MNLSRHRYLSKRKARWDEVFAPTRLAVAIGLATLIGFDAFEAGGATPQDSEWIIKNWDTGDGLPDNSVTAIAQTPDGYLWLGTFNGLARFNGVEFKVFTPENTPRLPSAGIVNLHVDRAGRLVVSTYRGLVMLEGTEWRTLSPPDMDFVRTFAERADGGLLMSLFNGKLFELFKGKLSELPPPPTEREAGCFGGADEDGRWWVVQNQFIGRWDNGGWVRMIPSPLVQLDNVCCTAAHDGGMWLLLGDALLKVRRGAEISRKKLAEQISGVWTMSEDSQGNVWIATQDKGFYRVAPDGRVAQWGAAKGWSDSGRCVFEDREGNLWIGTNGDGLLRLTPRRFQFLNLAGGSKAVEVHSLSTDASGGVWAATYGRGLFLLSDSGESNLTPVKVDGATPWVQSVLGDRAGRIWVGSFRGRLQVMDKGGTHDIAPPELRSDNTLALLEDSRGRVWFSRGGDFVADYDGKGFQQFGHEEGLFKGSVMGLAEEVSGALWVASYKGVYRRKGEQPFVEVKDNSGRSIEGIVGLEADQDGCMWLITDDRGLLRWKNGKFAQVNVEHGLPVSSFRGMLEDEAGYFWITSGSRIVRVLHSDLRGVADGRMSRVDCQVFDANDGLHKAEFTRARQPNCVRDGGGRLWFATTKGVVTVVPGTLRLNTLPPAVHIEEISFYRTGFLETNVIAGRPVVREHQERVTSPFGGRVRLPAGSHRIEIRYACLSFAAPEKVKTEVRLEGLDPNWRLEEGRVEQIHDLRPGNYSFQVRGANNDGIWNEAGESLALTMEPYYWQTTPFRLGVGVLLVSLGAVAAWGRSRSRVRRAVERERVARELADARQRMHLAAEAALLGLWSWDPNLNRFWATNRCRELLGFGAAETVNFETFFAKVMPEDQEPTRDALNAALSKGASYDIQFRVNVAGGEARWVAAGGRGECDQGGQPKRLHGVCVDITERKRASLEIQNLQRELAHSGRVAMMGQLASALAHELSQPLGAILRNSEAAELFLQGPSPDLEELRNIVTDIRRDDQRAGAVIDRLRELLKRRDIEMQTLDAGRLAEEVLPLLRQDAQGRRVTLELEKPLSLPLVRGDRVQLQQVLLNLVVNGMDSVSGCEADRRWVRLRVESDSERFVTIAVSDSGQGIPPDTLKNMFEPFFTTKPQGMGIGLSLSRRIVEAHGGRIWAVNNTEGGATFRFTVPVADGGGNGKYARSISRMQ